MTERDALFKNLARDIAGRLDRSNPSLIVPGGSSPREFYPHLAKAPIRWARLSMTLSDERWVPVSHEDSNEGMVRARLLRALPEQPKFLGLKTTDTEPDAAVGRLDSALRALPRPFDVCLLGMGRDGHIAGLIPGWSGAEEGLDMEIARSVIALHRGEARRISLTLPALLDSRWIAILCLGKEKAEVYRQAASGGLPDAPIARLLERKEVAFYWAP
jgi:6-phosphogluconolactonase